MESIQITSAGIKKALRKYDYKRAIAEYVWNGFDAQATNVDIRFVANAIGTIDQLSIVDNGRGIEKTSKFKPFLESDKALSG